MEPQVGEEEGGGRHGLEGEVERGELRLERAERRSWQGLVSPDTRLRE